LFVPAAPSVTPGRHVHGFGGRGPRPHHPPSRQAWALTGLVTAIAQAGNPDRAESLARTIPRPDDRARVLTDLANVIAQAGDPDRAARLLAIVLTTELPGRAWMKTMARFFPSAIGDAWDIIAGVYARPT
jgi:hypothetical protein